MRSTPLHGAAMAVAIALALSGCSLADARRQAVVDAAVKPAELATSLRPGLVGMSGYPATGWEESAIIAEPTTPSGMQATLTKIGLQKADVATKLVVKDVPDGTSLGIPTLDFCDGLYPSEALRVDRLQRGAYDADGNYAGISTEVVVYKDAAAAQQALREVTSARVNCPVGKTVSTFDGHKIVFAFHSAPGPANTPLVQANSRLVIHTTMKVDGNPQSAFLVYQIDGRVLAALYAMDASGEPYSQSVLNAFYALAGNVAKRLQQYAPSV